MVTRTGAQSVVPPRCAILRSAPSGRWPGQGRAFRWRRLRSVSSRRRARPRGVTSAPRGVVHTAQATRHGPDSAVARSSARSRSTQISGTRDGGVAAELRIPYLVAPHTALRPCPDPIFECLNPRQNPPAAPQCKCPHQWNRTRLTCLKRVTQRKGPAGPKRLTPSGRRVLPCR